MAYGEFEDEIEDEEQQQQEHSVVRRAISEHQSRTLPRYKSDANTPTTRKTGKKRTPSMAKHQVSGIGSFNIEEEIKAIIKAKGLSEEQEANLSQFWSSYFERRPDEMARLYHLRDENPNEFRAVLLTLPFAGNRHRIETVYFLMACFGMGCSLLFIITWLTGSFDGNRGWNYAKNRGALPNIVEALYSR